MQTVCRASWPCYYRSHLSLRRLQEEPDEDVEVHTVCPFLCIMQKIKTLLAPEASPHGVPEYVVLIAVESVEDYSWPFFYTLHTHTIYLLPG